MLSAVALVGAAVGVVAGGMVAEPSVSLTADLASTGKKTTEEALRTPDSGDLVHGTNVIVGSLPLDRLAGGIDGTVIADGTITRDDLGTASVGTDEIVDASNTGTPTGITTAKIEDGAVTNNKLTLRDGGIALSQVDDAASEFALGELTHQFSLLVAQLITEADGADTAKLVHASRIAGLDSATVGTASDVSCTGCVSNVELGNDLDAGKLTAGTLSTDRIADLAGEKITSGTISADRIADLDAGKITTGTFGDDFIGTGITASKISGALSNARIDAGAIDDGLLNMARIGTNAITGAKLALASDKGGDWMATDPVGITNDNIEPSTIQGDRLFPGAIGAAQLGAAQVSTDKLLANATSRISGAGSVVLLPSASTDQPAAAAGEPGIVIPPGGDHLVSLTGQAKVTCSSCSTAASNTTVSYMLIRSVWNHSTGAATGTTVVGQTSSIRINTADGSAALPVSFVDDVAPGRYLYQLRVIATDAGVGSTVGVSDVTVNVIDLGVKPAP